MTIETPNMQAALARVEKLERQNRHMTIGGAVALAAVVTLGVLALYRTWYLSQAVDSHQLIVRDDQGRPRAILSALGPLVGLVLYDPGGQPQAAIEVFGAVPSIILGPYKGARMDLRLLPGQPEITLSRNGPTRVQLTDNPIFSGLVVGELNAQEETSPHRRP